MSFTPDEIVFQAEKTNSDGSVSGSMHVDFGIMSASKYFKRDTKVTVSPTPKVSSLNAVMPDYYVERIYEKFEDLWGVGSEDLYNIKCDYQYYSLDSWTYTLKWEPAS